MLETFPRDELFQISPDQLARISEEVLKIDLTPRPRVFIRRDEFRRFVSVFIYVPRERHNTQVRLEIEKMLEEAFDGRLESATPFFPESAMVRVHFVLWRREWTFETHPRLISKPGREDHNDLERRVSRLHFATVWQRGI